MIKVVIKNLQNQITNQAIFASQELAEAWVNTEKQKFSFGRISRLLTEREVLDEGKSIEDAEEVVQPEQDFVEVKYRFPDEFSVEYTTIADPSIASAALAFLKETDWKVLRHVGQKALGVATSMTEEEYLALEQERQTKRGLI